MEEEYTTNTRILEWSWLRMSNTPIGNEEQMAQIRALMETKEKADEVNQGAKATNVVDIDFLSPETDEHYKGKIMFKRPNVMETMKMGGRKTQILKESGVVDRALADPGLMLMAEALATLEVVVVKCPEWFLDFQKSEDIDMIFHVYGQYNLWKFSFRSNGAGTQEGDSQPSA
jgi:hypothetical protein